jgi:hypothetical protein
MACLSATNTAGAAAAPPPAHPATNKPGPRSTARVIMMRVCSPFTVNFGCRWAPSTLRISLRLCGCRAKGAAHQRWRPKGGRTSAIVASDRAVSMPEMIFALLMRMSSRWASLCRRSSSYCMCISIHVQHATNNAAFATLPLLSCPHRLRTAACVQHACLRAGCCLGSKGSPRTVRLGFHVSMGSRCAARSRTMRPGTTSMRCMQPVLHVVRSHAALLAPPRSLCKCEQQRGLPCVPARCSIT